MPCALRQCSVLRRDYAPPSPLSRRLLSVLSTDAQSLNKRLLRCHTNCQVRKPLVHRTLLCQLSTTPTGPGKTSEASASTSGHPLLPEESNCPFVETVTDLGLHSRQPGTLLTRVNGTQNVAESEVTASASINAAATEKPGTNAEMSKIGNGMTDSAMEHVDKITAEEIPTPLEPKMSRTGEKATTVEEDDKICSEVSGKVFDYKTVDTKDYTDLPTLAHGLDRVLFKYDNFVINKISNATWICTKLGPTHSPGVHFLQDPRTNVMNFSPYLKRILQPSDTNFDTVPKHIALSHNLDLIALAKEQGEKFFGSTSTFISLLCHIYLLISDGKPPNISMLSKSFANEETNFSKAAKEPPTLCLRYKDGVYAIEKDNMLESDDSLMCSGHPMQLMLTVSPEKSSKSLNSDDNIGNPAEDKLISYVYGMHQDCMFHTQLDIHDPRLPNRTFIFKTRGSVGTRLIHRKDYIARSEQQYFDLIRTDLLKYYFEICIGKMDGVFMAYQNMETIYGFQYIPKEEMELCLFGNSVTGQEAFGICMQILQDILKTATGKYPEESLRLSARTIMKDPRACMVFYTEVIPFDLGLSKDDMRLYEYKTNPKLSKYKVEAYSTVNGTELQEEEKISLSSDGTDEWVIHYTIRESNKSMEETIAKYNSFNIFKRRFSGCKHYAKLSVFHHNVYDIARQGIADDEVEEDGSAKRDRNHASEQPLGDDQDRPMEDQEEKQDVTSRRISPSAMLEQLSKSKDMSKDIAGLSRDAMQQIISTFYNPLNGPTFAIRGILTAMVQHYNRDKNAQAIVEIWEESTRDLQVDRNDDRKLFKTDAKEGELSQELSPNEWFNHREKVNRSILKRLDQAALAKLADKLNALQYFNPKFSNDMDVELVRSAVGYIVAKARERVEDSKPGV